MKESTYKSSVQYEFEVLTHYQKVSTHENEVSTHGDSSQTLMTDDQVSTCEFKVSTHGDSSYQLKEESLKCRHTLPVASDNTKSFDTCS